MTGDDRGDSPEAGALDLERIFHALSPAARREYAELARRDLTFGEDVVAERRAGGGTVGGA
jgi:hypothetical protein